MPVLNHCDCAGKSARDGQTPKSISLTLPTGCSVEATASTLQRIQREISRFEVTGSLTLSTSSLSGVVKTPQVGQVMTFMLLIVIASEMTFV